MSSKHKDLGISAYQPIRSKALSGMFPSDGVFLPTEMKINGAKHSPQHTKPQFKKRRNKHGHVKIIRVR